MKIPFWRSSFCYVLSSTLLAAILALTSTGCQRGLSQSATTKLLQAGLPAAEPVFFEVNVWQEQVVNDLVKLGLVTFTPSKKEGYEGTMALTPEGKAAGVELFPKVKDSIEYVRIRLCDIVFGALTSLAPRAAQTPEVVDAAYVLKYANYSPLYERLKGTSVLETKYEPTAVISKKAIFVKRPNGWSLNHPPAFPADASSKAETKFAYDNVGRLIGATTELSMTKPATDADGDAITYSWSGFEVHELEGDKKHPAELETNGLLAKWKRTIIMGEPAGGVVTLTARDVFGDEATFEFCAPGPYFSCR